MDKYEFNIKVEQIKKLVNRGDYETAMKIADTIDWHRVRNASLLSMIAQIYEKNKEKAAILYEFLDQSKLFKNSVRPDCRSLMNVTFVTGDPELDKKFVAEAAAAGLLNLKGHRSVGGMRASIYNAMPREGVEALVAFMKEFEAKNR